MAIRTDSHYVEITREAWRALVSVDAKVSDIAYGQGYHKVFYFEKGCNLMRIEQSTSPAQYYIQDINA